MKQIKKMSIILLLMTIFTVCSGLIKTEVSAYKASLREVVTEINIPEAFGLVTYESENINLDASNTSEGYVMICYSGNNEKVKLCVETTDEARYTYLLKDYNEYVILPLTCGNGTYTISVYEIISMEDTKYKRVFSQELDVTLTNLNSPFLYPNFNVIFSEESDTVAKAEELAKNCQSNNDVVCRVYDYITKNIDYDYEKATNVKFGYVPNPDIVLEEGKGICFDYAALMTAMLRSQNIPTRLHVGYAGEEYHAWVSCLINDEWVFFDPTLGIDTVSETEYLTKYIY